MGSALQCGEVVNCLCRICKQAKYFLSHFVVFKMDFDDNLEVKEKLCEENYWALINAVEVGVINKQIMAELAKALGPRIRKAHEERMKTGAHNITVEMGKVLIDWYKDRAHGMTQEQAQGQLKTIFKHLKVVLPSTISMAQPFTEGSSQPTNNQTLQPVVVVDDEMEVSERKRMAFMVANSYKESKTMNPLLGTIDSVHNVKAAIEQHGFQAQVHSDLPFEEVKRALKKWKDEALASGSNPDALLFYFCGHGGHSPFECSAAHEEYEDTLVFSGSVGNISVGGDVLIDNNGRKMFKDEIMQTICKGVPVETHVILIFDCCRGKESTEMSMPFKPPPTFQLSVKPSRLGDLKNADLKNSYTFHATLPNQVAWCDKGEGTKFSRFFTEGLGQKPPVYIGILDEYINRRLDEENGRQTRGHKQMVQLDKRVKTSFQW